MSERTRMNLLDRSIAFVAPRLALRRMQAKRSLETEFGYNDQPHQRRGSGGRAANGNAETPRKQRERVDMMWDARQQVSDTWFGGVVDRILLYVVGQLSCKSDTGEPEVDSAYDTYLHNWAGDEEDEDGNPRCDISGRHRLRKLAELALGGMLVDGDHGMVWIPGDEETMPSLLAVGGDRIGSPLDCIHSREYIGGFTIDAGKDGIPGTGKILSVRITTPDPLSGQYGNPQEIAPANFMFLYDPKRGDMYRGRSHLGRTLDMQRDFDETMNAEGVAIKSQSLIASAGTAADPYNERNREVFGPKTGTTEENGKGATTRKAVYGQHLDIPAGYTFNMVAPPARPSGSSLTYHQLRIRMMATSLGVSYGFLWDLATLGGVTARIEVKGDARKFAYWRRLLVDGILRRARMLLLSHGVAYGHIPAHPNMRRCAWHFDREIITDAGYEINNDLQLAAAGLVKWGSLATKYADDGSDLADVQRANSGAVQTAAGIAANSRVPIELFAGSLMPNATAQLAGMETGEEDIQPPPPGSVQALGDKGAQQVFAMLESAANGSMPREEVIASLVTIYGMPQEQAEAICPEKQKQPKQDKESGGPEDREN